MINGFILVSIICSTYGNMVAVSNGSAAQNGKINCLASIHEVYKTKEECEEVNRKRSEVIIEDEPTFIKRTTVMPGSGCIEINKIIETKTNPKE